MNKLSNPGYVSRILAQHNIRLKKKWGQNFLVDENILGKIVAAAELTKSDSVLEIGPGIGTLTQKLAERAGRVYAVEIDGRLLPVLRETLGEYPNLELIHQDALALDYKEICAHGPLKMVANLPYYAATPLLYKLLKEQRGCFSLIVCMLQKEVAGRIAALPGTAEYGALSVICRYASEVNEVFEVPRTVFFPRPDVSSAIIRLRPFTAAKLDPCQENLFFRVVESLFAQRRKTALNTLRAAFAFSRDELAALGDEAGMDLSRRGETFSVDEFAKLTCVLYNKIKD